MKKFVVILMSMLIITLFLSGCGKEEEPRTEPAVEEPAEAVAEDTTMVEDTLEVIDTTAVEETTGE